MDVHSAFLIMQAQSYAEAVRGLDTLIRLAPVTAWERWHMRADRWVYGRKLSGLLDVMTVEERATALGVVALSDDGQTGIEPAQ